MGYPNRQDSRHPENRSESPRRSSIRNPHSRPPPGSSESREIPSSLDLLLGNARRHQGGDKSPAPQVGPMAAAFYDEILGLQMEGSTTEGRFGPLFGQGLFKFGEIGT